MEKIEIELFNTKLENVFSFLASRLQSNSEKSQRRQIVINDYADEVTRTVTYSNILQRPYRDNEKLIVKDHYYISVFPGKTDLTAEEITDYGTFEGLVFTGLQLLNDTVEIQFECSKVWEKLASSILSELRKKFPEPPIPSGPGYWALVENRVRNTPIFGGQINEVKPSFFYNVQYSKLPIEHNVLLSSVYQSLKKCKHRYNLEIEEENTPGSFTFTLRQNKNELGEIAILPKSNNLNAVEFRIANRIVLEIESIVIIDMTSNMLSPTRWEMLPDNPFELRTLIPIYDKPSQHAPADQPGQNEKLEEATTGKYDDLCKKWVTRPSTPYQNKIEFLSDHAPDLTERTFEKILMDAYKREVIDKTPGERGRYIPKGLSRH